MEASEDGRRVSKANRGAGFPKKANKKHESQLLNSRGHPTLKKVHLFDLYITSRWLWCCGLVWPTKQALKSLDSHKNTLQRGLMGFRADFFGEVVHNLVAKRRAVRYVLKSFGRHSWRHKWITQVWKYGGHVARDPLSTP